MRVLVVRAGLVARVDGVVGGGGFGAMDPDEAWDTRVGNEGDVYDPEGGYYEEQELSLRAPAGDGAYAGHGYGNARGTELDERYNEAMGRGNPFADHEDVNLRDVSPRPHDDRLPVDDSPTERRSMFKENV